jgi:hypothetical protein
MTTPARHYAWAPFEAGHELTLTHGAYSPRRIEPLASALVAGLLDVAPWCAVQAFRPAVAWANAEARTQLLRAYVDEVGMIDEATGQERPAVAALDRAERSASAQRTKLGLDPMAWATLRRAWVDDGTPAGGGLAGLKAVGAQMIDATPQAGTQVQGEAR